MIKSGIILKYFFVSILPIAIVLHFMTLGHWTVEYYQEGQKYTSEYVSGFPFPSHGMFEPVEFYNSGDESVSVFYIVTNWLFTLIFTGLLHYFIFRKYKSVKIPNVIWVFPIYLVGIIFLLPTFIWMGSPMPWVSDFKIISYHLWSF